MSTSNSRRGGTRSILFHCAALLLVVSVGWAQTAPRPSVTMGVKTNRETYWTGEPVVLTCRLVNWHSPVILLNGVFGLMDRMTEVRIWEDGIEGPVYRSHLGYNPATPKEKLLPYGKAFEYEILVAYDVDATQHIALTPGDDYRFAVHQDMQLRETRDEGLKEYGIFTDAVSDRIEVVDPPEEMRGALDLLLEAPEAMRDLSRRLACASSRAPFEKLVADYPESRYAPWCLHALANQARLLMNASPGQKELATAWLQMLLDNYPDYPLRGEAQMVLAEVYRLTGELDQSARIARELITEDPDNLLRFRTYPIMEPLAGPRPNPYGFINDYYWTLFPTTELTAAYRQLIYDE